MASILKVDTIQDQSGNNIINENADTITIGASGDTISIPAGATTTLTDGVSGDFKMNSGFGSIITAYGCRAWVYFNGTGVVAINGDGNVTSITDNGTGDYTVNFTTAMPDINFCVQHCARIDAISNRTITQFSGNLSSASSVSLLSRNYSTNTAADPDMFHVAVFR
jgi:hypothetical protein